MFSLPILLSKSEIGFRNMQRNLNPSFSYCVVLNLVQFSHIHWLIYWVQYLPASKHKLGSQSHTLFFFFAQVKSKAS